MAVLISLLRGVNVVGRHKVPMEALRALCAALDFGDARTYLQSGNVVFRTGERDLARLAQRLEQAVERSFGFHVDVIIRTTDELREAVAHNPFAQRSGVDPSKLLVLFLNGHPGPEAGARIRALQADAEECWFHGREAYIYYPDGMARPKLPWARVERALKISGTGRNWNTVRKLLEMAETLEAAG
jgi:uncharacterized protein (DUF1697 family)